MYSGMLQSAPRSPRPPRGCRCHASASSQCQWSTLPAPRASDCAIPADGRRIRLPYADQRLRSARCELARVTTILRTAFQVLASVLWRQRSANPTRSTSLHPTRAAYWRCSASWQTDRRVLEHQVCGSGKSLRQLPAPGHLRRFSNAADQMKTSRLGKTDQGEKMGELGSQMGENAHKFGLVESLRLRQLRQIYLFHQRVRPPNRLNAVVRPLRPRPGLRWACRC
jgi:hypothetical protein